MVFGETTTTTRSGLLRVGGARSLSWKTARPIPAVLSEDALPQQPPPVPAQKFQFAEYGVATREASK